MQCHTRKCYTHVNSQINVDCIQYLHNFPACASPYIQPYITIGESCVCCGPTLTYASQRIIMFLTLCHLDGSSSPPSTLSAAYSNIFVVVGHLGCAHDSVLFPMRHYRSVFYKNGALSATSVVNQYTNIYEAPLCMSMSLWARMVGNKYS